MTQSNKDHCRGLARKTVVPLVNIPLYSHDDVINELRDMHANRTYAVKIWFVSQYPLLLIGALIFGFTLYISGLLSLLPVTGTARFKIVVAMCFLLPALLCPTPPWYRGPLFNEAVKAWFIFRYPLIVIGIFVVTATIYYFGFFAVFLIEGSTVLYALAATCCLLPIPLCIIPRWYRGPTSEDAEFSLRCRLTRGQMKGASPEKAQQIVSYCNGALKSPVRM